MGKDISQKLYGKIFLAALCYIYLLQTYENLCRYISPTPTRICL
jgi:hypothetical protein